MKNHLRLPAAIIVGVFALAGCGGNNSVGSKSLLDIKGQANKDCGQLNGPQCTTTTSAPKATTTSVTAKAAVGGPTTSTTNAAQQQQKEQAKQAATVEVSIQSDSTGAQIVPSALTVYKGSFIKWINKDTVAQAVSSDDGTTFTSPLFRRVARGPTPRRQSARCVSRQPSICEGDTRGSQQMSPWRVRARRLAGSLVVCAVAAAGVSCGGKSAALGTSGAKLQPIDATIVPSELKGLSIKVEDIKDTLSTAQRAYLSAVSLYSFHTSDNVLQATLQVSRFAKEAKYKKPSFRAAVVNQIGSTVPKPFRIGADSVFITTGKRQNISVWFRGDYLFVLAVRDDFDEPRGLLRAALGIKR